MGVSKSSTSSNSFGCSLILISLIWVLLGPRPVLSDEILDEIGIHDSPSNTNSESDLKPTNEVKINYTIKSNNANTKENEFTQLIDTWWKILAWSLAVLILSCLCCYFSKCCYLCYDCCSDPFWGYCPCLRSRGCSKFLLMKGCCQTRRASKAGYDICHNDEETGNAKVNDNTNTDDLSEEDFTLRTVESLEVDAMLSKLSPIKGHRHCEGHSPNKSNTLDGTGNTSIAPSTSVKVVTSTPRKKKISSNSMKKEKMMEAEPILLEMSGEAESMPQLYPSHYFNIFNIFGVGKANYKVASVEENHKKYLIKNYYEPKNVPLQYVHNPNPNNNSKHQANSPTHDESTIALVSDEDELEDRSFDRSVMNNQDFPLSSSFSNMYKKNGLHIEEGQIGRYHQLPEARFELIPPSTFLRKIKRQNSTGGMHRRSRSMETFRDKTHTETVKKFTSGSLRRNETDILKEEDESSLPSPPPVPLVRHQVVHPSKPSDVTTTTMTCQNHNGSFYANSTTTTDEESEKTHKRAHSEGSRIGHRRTPSMEGVIQLQNGGYLRKNPSNRTTRLNQSSDLPPRIPHQSSSGHHNKKRHSHRKMKMIDINDEIEKCILFGKETTL